jgi:NADH dehydrogenase
LAGKPFEVVLIDRHNYHLFTPLLYQVASSLLNPSDIAEPVRRVLRGARNVHFRVGEVVGVDFGSKRVHLQDGSAIAYEYLVIATGSETHFFGHEAVERSAFGLKDLPEAMELRNHVLACFEAAVLEPTPEDRRPWLTFVVVGGGPTGVEYVGALSELIRLVMAEDFPGLDLGEVRVVLVEGQKRVLPAFDAALGEDAGRRLARKFKVELRLGVLVLGVDGPEVRLSDGERLLSRTLVWAAGVRAGSLTARLDLECTPSGRLEVDATLRVPDQEGVYAIGDVAGATQDGVELPMMAPPAIQQARYVASAIARGEPGRATLPFRYRDRGVMATIGRRAGVAQVGRLKLKGWVGWMAWLVVHLFSIIGFRNRLWVLSGWAWNYWRYDRPIRNIVEARRRSLDGGVRKL